MTTGLLCAVLVLLAGVYLALSSQGALDYVVRRAVTEAQGHLTIEGAEGSLLSTVRIARIAWKGDDIDVEARETLLVWSPLDLFSRKFIVQGLGAKRLSLDFSKAKGSSATGLPATLALPLEVDVRNIGVERLDWRTAEQAGYVTGITFGYAGGARTHAIRELRFVTEHGTLAGNAQLEAMAPFALSGSLAFDGDGEFKGGKGDLSIAGTLERIAVDAKGTLRNASVAAKAGITPFAPALVTSADIDARNVDLAQFVPALPTTALTLTLTARPDGAGFAGSLSARNEVAGPLDAGRVPVTALASQFTWNGTTLTLSGIDAQLEGGGRATGSVALSASGPVKLDLAIANVDLARLQSTLMKTRLSGTVAAEVQKDRQVVRGDLREADLALAFAAVVEGRKVTVERMRAQAGGGTLTGSGTLELDSPRAFTVSARAEKFNPARFVAVPEAQLDGTVTARGKLSAPFAITADVALDKGSRVAGLAVAGTARGELTPTTAKNVAVNAMLGDATIALKGAYGTSSDTIYYDVNVPRLAQLRPLAVRYTTLSLPDPIAGSLRARGTISGDPRSPGVSVDAHGEALEWGRIARAATLDVVGSIEPGPRALSERAISATVKATRVAVPQVELASLAATIAGTLAQHKVTLAATGEGIDFAASGAGGLAANTWSGTIETLANRGTYAVSLTGPATLVVARDRVEVGAARIAVAEGRVDVVRLVVDEGRITTQGSFTGVPVAAAAKLAGTPLPFASTLVAGGEWSLAATPRLNGTLNVRRERGDLFATQSTTLDPADLALGITVLDLTARFAEDALAASAQFRSARGGTADASLTLAAGRLPGRVDADAAFTASVTADLASLRPLQPWIGTVAVLDGRARADVKGRGTLANPILDGTLAADALRFDLPQYGVHLRDGRLRARLVERSVVLDEFSFAGGAGRFTAKGTLASAGTAAAGRVEWQAENFTVVNRPDLRLVADGKGTLTHEGGKLALAGSISIDEGRVEYEPSRVGTLSDDVVIVGQPRKSTQGAMRDLPLSLDLQVTLGRDFRFSGEGLDTRLAGRVHVVTSPFGTLTAKGTIRAVSGTYYVFGQRLDIDRGRLLFDGPIDNPALDVVALRRNVAVEAGVELSGTVKLPRVRLVSNPPVPDGEKLSWLLTGQGLDRATSGDLALLGAASASLLGQNKRPLTTQIANTIGLDDISVRSSGTSVTTGQTAQVVAFGKRISDRLTLVYEQGLSVASNALRIEYALSRTLTLRAEAGTVSSLGVYFRRSFD